MRVVLDTNVFISGVMGGKLGIILDGWKEGKFKLVVSEAIVHEYLDVINRPKFKISLSEITTVTDYLLKSAEFTTPTETISAVESDPTDNKFLEAAIAGSAETIVSGDHHLLELKDFRAIPIISAHQFLDWLAGQ